MGVPCHRAEQASYPLCQMLGGGGGQQVSTAGPEDTGVVVPLSLPVSPEGNSRTLRLREVCNLQVAWAILSHTYREYYSSSQEKTLLNGLYKLCRQHSHYWITQKLHILAAETDPKSWASYLSEFPETIGVVLSEANAACQQPLHCPCSPMAWADSGSGGTICPERMSRAEKPLERTSIWKASPGECFCLLWEGRANNRPRNPPISLAD
ncbi:unnamed protein product [Eretmochelys imbricata]